MNQVLKLHLRNVFTVFIAAMLCVLASYLLNRYTSLFTVRWMWPLPFFVILCVILNIVYVLYCGKPDFTGILMGGIVTRLLLSLIYLVILLFFRLPDFYAFSIHFIIHYILFTVFEIRYLLGLIHPHKQ
jgi:hypothetical protein